MQGLPRASVKPQAEVQPQASISQLTEAMRKSIGFGASRTASASEIPNGSFESIGSHFGSRMQPSHTNSHDSDAGGNRTGVLTTPTRTCIRLAALMPRGPLLILNQKLEYVEG